MLGYGGDYFEMTLPASSIPDPSVLANTKVMVLRSGFATHAINFVSGHLHPGEEH